MVKPRKIDVRSFVQPAWGSLSMAMERFMPCRDERTAMERALLAVSNALDTAHGINPYTGCAMQPVPGEPLPGIRGKSGRKNPGGVPAVI